MNHFIALILVATIVIAIVAFVIWGIGNKRSGPRPGVVAKLMIAFPLMVVAAFCIFGFLARFELNENAALPWAAGYAAVGFTSAACVGLLCWNAASEMAGSK